jgi:hypothetical protein
MSVRIKNGIIGEAIVKRKLIKEGWLVKNANETHRNCPNYDLEINKGNKTVRIQVKAKKHKEKASICGSWSLDETTFNKSSKFDKADYLVMVRFMDEENECFVIPIDKAEELTDWFANETLKLGLKTIHLQPFVSRRPRPRTIYKFNTREPWEPYSEAWHLLE